MMHPKVRSLTMLRRTSLTALFLLLSVALTSAQSLSGRVYVGRDIMNQGKEQSSVEADVRIEFVSATEARMIPSIKAKPDANFMMKFGLKMAQRKMSKAVAEKPLKHYTQSGSSVTIIGGGHRGKGDAHITILDDGRRLRCNDGERTYTLEREK